MRTIYILGILVLLAIAAPASPAHAGGVVTVCDEAHLLAALAGGGTVTFACSGTITLTAEITIAADTTIDGSGQTVTISGNHAVRVFSINAGARLILNRLAIANGRASYGGGIYNSGGTVTVSNSTFSANSAGDGGEGGGIFNAFRGRVTVSNSTFSANSAPHVAGGVSNYGTLTINNSTFSGNISGNYGGGTFNAGTLTVSNSTFYANTTGEIGGGILNDGGGEVDVSNSTFVGNNANFEGGGIDSLGTLSVRNSTFSGNSANSGGGIHSYNTSTVTLKNTIIANSPTGGNCAGTITDGGGNLSYPDTTCPGINADPMLGPLQNNGGPTLTMEPGPGSAAIDAGIDAICAAPPVNNLDQRGITRPAGAHCDIGAVERLPFRKWLPTILSQ